MSSREDSSDRVVEHTRKYCSFKYRIRWFHSKGAALVLLWIVLINATAVSLITVKIPFLLGKLIYKENLSWVTVIVLIGVCVSFLVCAPLAGWLADARLGNYKVFKTGFMFLFFATVMACVSVLVLENIPSNNNHVSLVICAVIVLILLLLVVYSGLAACLVTSLQLGLDQMPDASTANITSFIAWYVCCFFAGVWISGCLYELLPYSDSNCFQQMFSLLPVLCMAIVLCSDFLLSPKWLIIEPKSSQSLKIIFRVLKFAAKHKAPVNRSALTYWEEDIPSRIDLGKSKYGGPFTTEQVEDVKTVFKLLVVSISFFTIVFSASLGLLSFLQLNREYYMFPGISWHNSIILSIFTYNIYWCVFIGTLVYEFVIYPFARNKLPSILKRIGAASFVTVVLCIVSLVLSVLHHYDSSMNIDVWRYIVLQVMSGIFILVVLSAVFEFVCAQSPYNMRALVTSCATLLIFSSIFVPYLLRCGFYQFLNWPYYFIISNSITLSLAVIGFLLHCILAHWYKMRVRDDIYSPHRLVEEVYDRYLSAQPQVEFD